MNINATLIGQSVAFFIFVMFCMKYVWPPGITAMRPCLAGMTGGHTYFTQDMTKMKKATY